METTIKEAQAVVRKFAADNGWHDHPNIDKIDHLHEELVEMSRLLRYKNKEERIQSIKDNHEEFVDGIGDLFFGVCRLANQLDVDVEEAFAHSSKEILRRYDKKANEQKH